MEELVRASDPFCRRFPAEKLVFFRGSEIWLNYFEFIIIYKGIFEGQLVATASELLLVNPDPAEIPLVQHLHSPIYLFFFWGLVERISGQTMDGETRCWLGKWVS